MLLTITTTHVPATDLGFLLEKHPGKVQEFELAFGRATVFYPEATQERCTVALLLHIDPIGLVRSQAAKAGDAGLDQYVNDRPYVASSFLSVAIGTVLKSAMAGKSRHRPDLADSPIALHINIPAVPVRGGEHRLHQLFEPLGYTVQATRHMLDDKFPEWGLSSYYDVELTTAARLQDVLRQLYVLIPVLDDRKHYWVDAAEVEKLTRHASEWLPDHPLRDWIARRYFKHKRSLARQALEQLTRDESEEAASEASEGTEESPAMAEAAIERPLSLNEQRLDKLTALVSGLGVTTVVDLGCGEGRLLSRLLSVKTLDRIVGMDVSVRSLEFASERLHLDRMPPRQRARIDLIQGSLVYKDERLSGFDAATLIEVIEHLEPQRLAALELTVFEAAHPKFIIVTTPNREYNVKFTSLQPGRLRHSDHRFEWTRAEFRSWCERLCDRFRYHIEYHSVGEDDPVLGPPTQLALFSSARAG